MSKTITQLNFHFLDKSSPAQQQGAVAQILTLFLVAIVFTALVLAFVGYQFGYRQGVNSVQDTLADKALGADASALATQNTELQLQLDAIIKERDISLNNFEHLSAEKQYLQTKNLQLEQTNALLKASVAEQGGVALKVTASEISSLPDNTFEYRFDVAMIDVSGKAMRMTPRLTLLNSTSMVEIPLTPSSYEINGAVSILGRFVMPDGFVPRQMKLELIAGEQKVQQLYNWRVGKMKTNASLPPSKSGMNKQLGHE